MKAILKPLYFQPGRDGDFDVHLDILKELLGDEADFLEPLALGRPVAECDAVVFPQMLGEAYHLIEELEAIEVPILVLTSDFGTVNMWDWEIVHYLGHKGIRTVCPPSLGASKAACRALTLKRMLKSSKFVVYQDDPAGPSGEQSEIFKRFYWLENDATRRFSEKYGLRVEQRSFKELGKRATAVSDEEARESIEAWPSRTRSIQGQPLLSAMKLAMELKKEYEKDTNILAMGLNCLNESHSCDTTPCLAWNLLYESHGLTWGCEADTMTMLTELLADKVLQVPFMMTNVYPFIMGKAALSHERIPYFPDVEQPENHVLAAHCGYFGLMPEVFATEWNLRERVLAMVDENATMIDARFPEGPVTLMKFQPFLNKLTVTEAELTGYVQYEDSDCLNGGIIRLPDGRRFVDQAVSHHYVVMTGHQRAALSMIGKVLDYEIEDV